jgi:hypothetical protein
MTEPAGQEDRARTHREEIVAGYVRRCPPAIWIDWWLRFKHTSAGNCLYTALFNESGETKDLTDSSIREYIISCVMGNPALFDCVSAQAEAALVETVDRVIAADETPSASREGIATAAFRYRCGLKPTDRLRLRMDFSVLDEEGSQHGVHKAGEVWEVLPPSKEKSVLWLLTPAGDRHTWDDNDSVFDTFERWE